MKKSILQVTAISIATLGLIATSTFAQGELSLKLQNKLGNSILLHTNRSTAFVNGNKTSIDNNDNTIHPYAKNNRTLLPVRFISESLGAKVDWDGSKNLITIKLNNDVVKFIIGSKRIEVNGVAKYIDVPAEAISNRSFIPIRALAESLGKEVFWDNRGVIVLSNEKNILSGEHDMLNEIESIYKDSLEQFFKSIDKNILNIEAYEAFNFNQYQIAEVLGQPTSKSKAIEQGYGGTHQDWIYKGKGIEIDMVKFDNSGYNSSFIKLTSPFKYKTKEGVGIGSTKQEVIAAYGDIITSYEKTYDGHDSIIIGYNRSSGIAIDFKNNKVSYIQLGEHPN